MCVALECFACVSVPQGFREVDGGSRTLSRTGPLSEVETEELHFKIVCSESLLSKFRAPGDLRRGSQSARFAVLAMALGFTCPLPAKEAAERSLQMTTYSKLESEKCTGGVVRMRGHERAQVQCKEVAALSTYVQDQQRKGEGTRRENTKKGGDRKSVV